MTIETLWGWRKDEDGPELLQAWDAISVDENLAGWQEACAKALEATGDDLYSHRYIKLDVDYDAILAAFHPTEVKAKVEL